jgi:hypothetical protein
MREPCGISRNLPVADRLRHRGDHVARQVGLDARHQGACDHRSSHHLVRRSWQGQVAGIAGFRRTAFEERILLILAVLRNGRIGCRLWRLRRRRGWSGGEWVEARQWMTKRSRGLRRSGRRSGLARTAQAEEHRRGRSRIGLLAQGILRVMARRCVCRRHRLLRLHDGRAEIARQRWPQLQHCGRQLRVVGRQVAQSFRLRHAIHVVQLGLLLGATPLRLQRPDRGSEHGD